MRAAGIKLMIAACLLGWLALPSRAQSALDQSALEMSVNCRPIAYAPIDAENTVLFPLTFKAGICWGGFIALQQVAFFVDDRKHQALEICLPPESTVSQFARIFVRYADGHPEAIKENWVRVAHRSLMEAFPCPKSAEGPAGGG